MRRHSCCHLWNFMKALQWRHNDRDGVSNHQPRDCLLNSLFRRRSQKTSKLRVTGLCEGNSPVTGEFPEQRASNSENVSIWWHHHGKNVSIYLRVYSLHHNVLPTLQSIPLMTNGPLYPITQDSSCHGQHTMPRNPWSFPWPVPHSCVCMNVCVLQWRKL